MRKNITTHTPSEERVGYSRAVVFNDVMYVSGTTSIDEKGETVGKTLYEQTTYIFKKIERVLEDQEFTLNDVLIIRAYITEMEKLSEFDKVFKEFFYEIKPTCTLIGITTLVSPDLLVEIECTAHK